MYRYQEGSHSTSTNAVRPASSLSSGSTDSGVYSVQQQTSGPQSRTVSGPPSPALQINHLLHQTANLIAVNAQLRKEIEQVRAATTNSIVPPPPPSLSASVVGGAPVGGQQTHDFGAASGGNNVQQENIYPFDHHNMMPPSSRQSGKRSPKPDSYKTVMCQAWLESKVCLFAENCRFAHGETELRPSRIQPKQNNKYKTKLCDKYTTSGLCPYGNRCLFIHPDNGNNAYIRPDKLVEVSQRHAMADLCQLADSTRPTTPVNCSTSNISLCPTPMRSVANHLRPHPSWPLEPATFFLDKNEDEEPKQVDIKFTSLMSDVKTPHRPSLAGSAGYSSGGSTPLTDASPFSTVSSSSVNLHLEEEHDFDFFPYTGLDSLTEELARNLELW